MPRSRFALLVSFLVMTSAATAGATQWCGSHVSIAVPSAHVFVCPYGDGETLAEAGATITVQVIDDQGFPAPGMPPGDLWLLGCDDLWTTLCAPFYSSIDADATTDANGMTTISGAIRGGGSGSGLWVVVGGSIATGEWFPCGDPICLPITVVSPDINGDLLVDLVDFSLFAGGWPPLPYDPALDFDGDSAIDLIDLSIFAAHFLHGCQ